MKPPPFDYHDPRTVADACALLGTLENAKVLAGGQSLMPMLNLRLAYPDDVVDINRIPELGELGGDGPVLRIGATVRQATAERDPGVRARLPLLAEALGHVGHFQTRNRGTIGGSIAHLDPAAELTAVACATDATVRARSTAGGDREIPFAEFPQGFLTSALEPEELLTAVDFPCWPAGHGSAFEEYARRHGDFAVVAVAALLDLDPERRVRRCAVAVIGLGSTPVRATETEALLTGAEPAPELIERAAAAAAALPATGDEAAPAGYRRSLAAALTRDALHRAAVRAGEGTR